jgi:glycosyltransferase involved in cell wall biosynthesis
MRVLMLGWEFSPAISGGIGTACYGLTRALSEEGVDVLFVLPRAPELERAPEFELINLEMGAPASSRPAMPGPVTPATPSKSAGSADLPYSASEPAGLAQLNVEPTLENLETQNDEAFTDEAVRHDFKPEYVPHETAPPPPKVEGRDDRPPLPPAVSSPVLHVTRTEAHTSFVPAPAGMDHVEFIPLDALLWPYRRADSPWRPEEPQERRTFYEQVRELHEIRQHYPTPPAPEVESPRYSPPAWAHALHGAVAGNGDGAAERAEQSRDSGLYSTSRRAHPPTHARPGQALFVEIERFSHLAAEAAAGRAFDVVHAHDWMTFPAAQAIAESAHCPLVVHVHSTEFDRSAFQIDQRIYDIERRGLERADLVIAVSHLTQGILTSRYGVPAEKIEVVYNAVHCAKRLERDDAAPEVIAHDEKIVLFLGRITMQKGPEYFLAAARKVLQVYSRVRFVMAGSGDAVQATMALAEDMGLGDKIIFTGFLEGDDVERVFRAADLYVMPSVSDPFGIAALEALSYDVPVLISKQSGAAEVLRHVLKVDFWDIEEMANKIVAVLRHPPLHAMLKSHGSYEVRRLSWQDAAKRCVDAYHVVRGEPVSQAAGGRLQAAGLDGSEPEPAHATLDLAE